ncbi:MAG: glycosyltransferase family 4 protein [Candidatus Aenigmatarchaeota archaeon]
MERFNNILMFCPTLWGNNIVRTYPFVRALGGRRIIVAGWLKKGKSIYEPYKGRMNFLPLRTGARLPYDLLKLMRAARKADVIHCFKPIWSSMLPAWALSKLFRKPLVLDIEDLDWKPGGMPSLNSLSHFIAKKVRVKTVHSTALQRLWGGKIIRTGADESFFETDRKGAEDVRKSLGLKGKFVIIFAGAIRPHKGFEILAEAVKKLPNNVVLLSVGAADETSVRALDAVRRDISDRLVTVSPQPFEKMPSFLAASDMVVLPQLQEESAEHQIPAKLYDAMAASKSIAVSDVGDMPEILGNTGIVFRAGDSDACTGAIRKVMDNPAGAEVMGKAARARCKRLYSADNIRQELLSAYSEASR